MKNGLSVLPSFRLSGRFLGTVSLVFSKFVMVLLETHLKLFVTEPDFLRNNFFLNL